jgi:hypothetical protein
MIFESVTDTVRQSLVGANAEAAPGRRVQRVPFAALRGILDRDRVDALVRRHRLRRAVGQMLLRSRIDRPEDVLRVPQLGRVATAEEMWRLVSDPQPPADVLGTERILHVELIDNGAFGIVSGRVALATGRRRVFIADASGDLISAELGTDAAIDQATIRVGGYRHFQLAHLAGSQLRNLLVRLHDPVAISASIRVANNGQATVIHCALAQLAHALRVIQSLTEHEARMASQLTTAAARVDEIGAPPSAPEAERCPPGHGVAALADHVPWQMDVDRCCAAYRVCDSGARTARAREACRRGLYESTVRCGADRGRDYTAFATLLYVVVCMADGVRGAAVRQQRRLVAGAVGLVTVVGLALWAFWSWG